MQVSGKPGSTLIYSIIVSLAKKSQPTDITQMTGWDY